MELTTEQKKQVQKIGEKHRLDFIVLHGSQVTGKKGLEPDVDIAIYRSGGIDFKEQMKLFLELSAIFGELGELDLKTLHKTNPLFRYYVVRDGVLLYGNMTDYLDFKAYAVRDYQESQSLFKLESFLVQKQQKELEQRFNVKY